MSQPSSPKKSNSVNPPVGNTLEDWIYNIRTTLHFPTTVILILVLLIGGTFIETAPRKSLAFLDCTIGHMCLFIFPLLIALFVGWAAGLLAASISLIIFAHLQNNDDGILASNEGFLSATDDTVLTTKLVSNPHRWFVEKVLGEMPVAISSDRIQTKRLEDNDTRTSSSSSMSSSFSSDSAYSSSSNSH